MGDAELVALWLAGRPATTARAYRGAIIALAASLGHPLADAKLGELQRHAASLTRLAPRSQARAIAAIRSFYVFHVKQGTVAANPAAALQQPRVPQDLAQRILTEAEVARLIAGAATAPDRLMLRLLYLGGLRAAELCGLTWRDIVARDGGAAQATVIGKGGKTRAVLLPAGLYADIVDLKAAADPMLPVFPSPGDPTRPVGQRQLLRIIKRAARAAGLSPRVSMHWLRHSHASHAIDNGCPITLVQATLGHSNVATTSRYLHARPSDGSARFLRG